MAFSPDGKLLAATEMMGNTVHLWDMTTGKERSRFSAGRSWAGQVAFSPDSKTLAVGAWDRIRLFDTASGKEILPFGPFVGHEETVCELAFAPDGQTLASRGEGDDWLLLWNPFTGKEVRKLDLSGAGPIAFSADGTALASSGEGGVVRTWAPATGKVLPDWREEGQKIRALTFSPAGHLLALGEQEKGVTVWDVTAGRPRWWRRLEHGSVQSPQFSGDGKALLLTDWHGPCYIWEAETGRERHRVVTQAREHFTAPSGQLLAAVGEEREFPDGSSGGSNKGLELWKLSAWREPQPFLLDSRDYDSAAFSPDGRVVAAGSGEYWKENEVRLYEVASGKQVGCFRGHRQGISCLAFSTDGRMLASGSYDQTALVWDLTGFLEGGQLPTRQPPPEGLKELWAHLGSSDAPRAYQAMWKLVAGQSQAVAFLREHLRPASPPDSQRLARLLADLDADRFAVREKAAAELEQFGEPAAPALREAMANKASPEVRRRAERILDGLPWRTLPAEELQALRAVAALEHIGSSDARQILESLTHGAPEARLTQEARSALRRLDRRAPAVP